jgi:hypothetical protein
MKFLHLLFLSSFVAFFVFADDSPIAVYVDRLNERIPEEKQQEKVVWFLKDIDIWNKYLKDAAKNDLAGLKAVYDAFGKPFGFDPPDNKGATNKKRLVFIEKNSEAIKFCDAVIAGEENDIKIFVQYLVEVLEAYDDVMKDPEPKNRLKNAKQLGDTVDDLCLALKELKAENWDKEFYDKLVKAVEKEKDKSGEGFKGVDGDWKKYWPHILLAVAITVVVIAIVVFFIMRGKKQANP